MKDITPTEKKVVDWERIEAEYRAGQLSTREIAKQHGLSDTAIRKRAKAEGWEKDLTEKVKEKVRADLVRTSVRRDNASDREIIDAAAARGVEVVRQHMRSISLLQQLEEKLMLELGDEKKKPTKVHVSNYQGEVTLTVLEIAVTERASALQALASVQHKRIQLERQAFNLSDDDNSKKKETPTINVIHQTIMQQSQVSN